MPIGTTPTNNVTTSIIDNVTVQQYMDGAFENALNYDATLRKMKEAGNIKMDAEGSYLTRNSHVGLPVANDRAAATARTFAASREFVNYSIPWNNQEVTGAITFVDMRVNSGPSAKVNLTKTMLDRMGKGLRTQTITDVLTKNASTQTVAGFTAAASNPVPLGGLPTLFGYGSTAQNYVFSTNATTGNVAAGDKEVLPDTTYYGVSTQPITGLTATIDNPQKGAASPVIANTTSTAWTGTATWAANARKVLDHMMARLTKGDGPDEQPDFAVMTQVMHTAVTNLLDAQLRVVLSTGSDNVNQRIGGNSVKEIPYGFLTLHWSAYLTQEVCYVLNSKKMEFNLFPAKRLLIDNTMTSGAEGRVDSMFAIEGQYDITQGAHLAVASRLGAMWMEPRYHGMAYAAA